MMTFCTSIHCMDGRIQEPIIRQVKKEYSIDYVDTVTEPGPCKVLAENRDKLRVESILNRVNISVHKHGSKLILISGHYDCAGNPEGENTQREQVKKSIELLRNHYPGIDVIGWWIDSEWNINPV